VASSGGAALRDVLKTLSRRYPAAAIVYPAPAQGADAAVKIAAAIALAGKRAECDVLLVCRGGGGIEDLWAYNSEEVAAAIFSSPIPVVTGVGHESDETIADYVADYRAATPTAAAVAAAPDREAALAALADFARRITAAIRRGMDIRAQRIDAAARVFARPGLVLAAKEERVNVFARRLIAAARNAITRREDAIAARAGVLRALDPARVLARGYAIVTRSGAAVLRASQVKSGDVVDIAFARGTAQAEIIDKHRQSAKARG
jgi:exodeoxyribonuclease VII large subunit